MDSFSGGRPSIFVSHSGFGGISKALWQIFLRAGPGEKKPAELWIFCPFRYKGMGSIDRQGNPA
jgi:hypothetical protein